MENKKTGHLYATYLISVVSTLWKSENKSHFGMILMQCAQLAYLEIQLVVTKEHKFMVTQCGMDSLLLLLWDCGSGLGSSKHFWHKYEELLCTGSQQHFTTCENFTSACYYKSLLLSADGENTWDMIYDHGR